MDWEITSIAKSISKLKDYHNCLSWGISEKQKELLVFCLAEFVNPRNPIHLCTPLLRNSRKNDYKAWNVHFNLRAEKEKTSTASASAWQLPTAAGYWQAAGKKAARNLPFLTKALPSIDKIWVHSISDFKTNPGGWKSLLLKSQNDFRIRNWFRNSSIRVPLFICIRLKCFLFPMKGLFIKYWYRYLKIYLSGRLIGMP